VLHRLFHDFHFQNVTKKKKITRNQKSKIVKIYILFRTFTEKNNDGFGGIYIYIVFLNRNENQMASINEARV
jgi:hypothetical protein